MVLFGLDVAMGDEMVWEGIWDVSGCGYFSY